MSAEVVFLAFELPEGIVNLAAHARQEWRAACREYREQRGMICRRDAWDDAGEMDRLIAFRERRDRAWRRLREVGGGW